MPLFLMGYDDMRNMESLTLRSKRHPIAAKTIASPTIPPMVKNTAVPDFTSLHARVSASVQTEMNSDGLDKIVEAKSTYRWW